MFYPYHRLQEAGYEVHIGAPEKRKLQFVVHDELQLALLGCPDVHLVAGLLQAVVRVEHLEGLGGVAGEDEDLLGNGSAPS